MDYNPSILNRRSIRLPHWDYRANAAYFVTICTFGRACLFDDVELLKIVEHTWRSVVGQGKGHGEFVVMPNHVHGIVWITRHGSVGSWRPMRRRMREGLEPGSLPVIIRSFKSAAAKRINSYRRMRGTPVWQHDYYEHVVRDEDDLNRIRQYILDNPRKWEQDPDNPAASRTREPHNSETPCHLGRGNL